MDGDCAAGGGSGVGFDLATHVQPDVVAGGVGGRSGFIVAVFPDVCPGRAERRIVVVAGAGAARLDAPFFRLGATDGCELDDGSDGSRGSGCHGSGCGSDSQHGRNNFCRSSSRRD